MTGLIFLALVFLCFLACAICGNLSRIADAVEAQNKHYGIGTPDENIDAKRLADG